MTVVFEELTFCVGDGCVNRFADDGGWEGYCVSRGHARLDRRAVGSMV